MSVNMRVVLFLCASSVAWLHLSATAASAQSTALHFDSQAGDPVGGGLARTYLPPAATFSVFQSSGEVFVSVSASGFFSSLSFAPPTGGTLAPGVYLNAAHTASPGNPRLSVSAGSSCSRRSGRFTIRELVITSGTVQRFAADFEQHCNNIDPALFGSIRYNSTVTTLPPFDGAYPDYRLTIAPAAHGTITGDGIACSATQSACARVFGAPANMTLNAVPDPGYSFLGWRGACEGVAPATVRVNQPLQCTAAFDSAIAPSPRTLLYMDSRPGDALGKGAEYFYDTTKAEFSIEKVTQANGTISVRLSGPASWDLRFSPGQNAWTVPSTYYFGVSPIFSGSLPNLNISGSSSSCSVDTGRFAVLELVKTGDGTVTRFAADFEVHCAGNDSGLFGSIRYNSLVYSFNPFGGAYPVNHLDIVPAAHGVVTGGGVSCGPTQNVCSQTFATPATITLIATPDPGYVFLGWSGWCAGPGAVHASVRVNQRIRCEALFDSLTAPTLRTGLFMDSQAGDWVGRGRTWLYSPADGRFSATQSGRAVQIGFQGKTWWDARFAPGPEGWKVPGAYFNAKRYPFNGESPGLDVTGDGRGCNQQGGWFYVYELEIATDGTVTRFAADFDQHCENRDVAMYGSVRYNSTIPSMAPFNGAYPSYLITVARPVHGTVTGGTISCGRAQNACAQYLPAPGDITLTATPDPGYTFSGWRGDCSGGGSVTLHVNQPRQCQAIFRGPGTVISSDVDGDILDDLAVWRSSVGMFYWATSSSGYAGASAKQWGSLSAGDVPFMADMDGDGKSDLIVWRASTGTWYWLGSASGYSYAAPASVQWGNAAHGDIPSIADMDGDGRGDLVLWRASTGTFYWLTSSSGYSAAAAHGIQWGNSGLGDKPLLADFDGDDKTDLGVWRANTGTWYWLTSSTGYAYESAAAIQWGNNAHGDTPFAGDVDGDGKADPIVWRASTGTWYWLTSTSGFSYAAAGARQFGNQSLGDVPLLKDLDGDGQVDLTVWRASTGTWYWLTSSSGFTISGSRQFGSLSNGDIPIGR
jgi:hypothetical protein